jgi:hypothetical protein
MIGLLWLALLLQSVCHPLWHIASHVWSVSSTVYIAGIAGQGLVLQFQLEAQTGSVDIFIYTGTAAHCQFWGPDGPYMNSEFYKNGKLSHIIIIASQNVSGGESTGVAD